MDFKIVLMPLAMDDLEEITRHIAEHNPEAAERFGIDLIDATVPLAQFPQMGRRVPEYNDFALREIIVESYRIVYRLISKAHEIHVLRFWHSARGAPNIEFDL